MELLDGLDVREAAPLPAVEVCRLLRDVASALAMLHARRLLHRDISYRNVRCTSGGNAKLIDFGAMMPIGTTTEVIGTRPFIAPESVQRGELDARSDLYSLGALAYWMLSARHAFPASNLVTLQQLWALPRPPRPSTFAGDVPAELDQLVMSLLSLDPAGRPGSAGEVMDRLGAIANLPPAEDLRVAEAYLARPALVGRERELKRIRAHLRADADKRGPLLIEGCQGVGKTRVLEELVIEAKLAGALAVQVAGSSSVVERYGVARELVQQLSARFTADTIQLNAADRAVLATEFAEFKRDVDNDAIVIPAGELRHRLQNAFALWIGEIGRHKRLVLVVDDFQNVDEQSASMLAALAADRDARNVCLALTLLEQQAAPTPAVRLLRQLGATLPIRRLRSNDISQLVDGVFGAVPNSGRVAHWLYARTRGNPLECMELTRYLVERELVHYAEGTWILPASLTDELPLGLQETRKARVAALPATQRNLAEMLAILSAPASLTVCAELTNASATETARELQALVRLELLNVQDGDYAYPSESLRQAIESSISPERTAELHELAGQLLERGGLTDLRVATRSAQHLMRGRSARKGADMIAAIARDPNVGRDVGEFFTKPVELALKVYEEQQRAPAETMPLRARLLQAAFMYDRRLVHYAEGLLPQLKHDAGFDLLTNVHKAGADWLPEVQKLAQQRYASTSVAERGLPPTEAVAMLSSVTGAVLAAAILKWDSRLIERLWEVVAPLAALGNGTLLSVAPELVGFYVDALRIGEACNHEQRVAYIARLRDPQRYAGLPEDRRLSILATQLHNIGMACSVLDGESALRLADEIDGFGMQMYQGAAMQVRLMVAMYRGQAAEAQQCRARLDVLAVQGGAGTQFEFWLAPYLADPYALCDDVIGLKQAVAHLKRIADADPGYEPMMLVALGHYHRARRDHRKALVAFERACALAPRNRHASWLLALSGRVDTLVEAGEFKSAYDLGTELLSSLNYGPRFSALIQQRMVRSMALARAHLGDIRGAIQDCEDAIAKELALGKSPLQLGRLHEARARMALLEDDRPSFMEHLSQVRAHFAATMNPLLVSRGQRLAAAGRTHFGRSVADTAELADEADTTQQVSAMSLLQTATERSRRGLELVQRETGAEGAYLYLLRGEDLELVMTDAAESLPDGLDAMVTLFFNNLRQRADRTESIMPESKSTFETMTLSCGTREFMPLPLSVVVENNRVTIGLVVLAVAERIPPSARQLRLLDAIAQALSDAGDVVLQTTGH